LLSYRFTSPSIARLAPEKALPTSSSVMPIHPRKL
jgi:hypothetical protein